MPFSHPSRLAAVIAGYGALFLLFDTTATLFEVVPGVSTWYPSAGLNLALLIVLGVRFAPLVFIASFLSGLLIADPPIPAHHLVLPNLVIVLANAAAATWLRRTFEPDVPFGLGTIARFILVAFGLPVVISLFAVGAYVLTGMPGYSTSTIWNAVSSWWVADTVGILTITPLCLLGVRTFAQENILGEATQAELSFHLTSLRGVATALVDLAGITAGVGAAFFLLEPGHFLFYICFLPLLWIALRNGLPRASIAVFLINLSAAFAIQRRGTSADLLEFQFFMVALALTGLLVAVLVSERRRPVHILQSATARLNNRLDTVPMEHRQAAHPAGSESSGDGETGILSPEEDLPEMPPGLWRLSDILASSSDVLSRSADNMVALNDMLHDSKVRLGKLNKQKNRLLSLISHDLKNPLMGIRGLVEVMNDNDPPERFARPLMLVERSAQQGLDLLDNLLTWSRLQAGHFAPSDQTHRLRTLAGEALAQLETQAIKKGVAIENNIDPGLVVHVDPFIVDTVLRNLVSNAIKFTPRGGYTNLTAYPAGEFIEVAVTDTGVGISPEQLGSLFTIEQRTSTAGTEGENGTGLGLHICQELLEAEGGTIWVDSIEGTGTTFYFTLPTPSARSPSRKTPDLSTHPHENVVSSPGAPHDAS